MTAEIITMTPATIEACIPEVLSPSSLNCFQDCSAKWYYRKVLQLPEERSASLALGSAVHVALGENFKQKIHTHEDLPFAGVQAVFRDAFEEQLDGTVLAPEDDADDLRSCGETLVRVYMDQAAPSIQPAAVELHVEGEIGGVGVHCFVDLLDVNGDDSTRSRKPRPSTCTRRPSR
jgi:CRISPR/Cas system-associated exonuclease Cas4 (RecB family)